MRNNRDYNILQVLLMIFAFALIVGFSIDTTGETIRKPVYLFIILAIAIIGVIYRRYISQDVVVWTIAGGFLVKLAYIIYTPVWTRQHDVISFGAGEGHAAYIEYLLYNRHLPDFDPRQVWAFFQPPLHHLISAAWMWICAHASVAELQIQENVQVLTLAYMCVLTCVVYFICKELTMTNRGTLITMIIVSFHPIYILLSGSINNDALSIVLSAVAIYLAVLWDKNSNIGTIILMALSIGFAMMAKLSAGLIAPGIAVLMLYKLITQRDKFINYIVQYIVFAVVVFPIGLWWPVRNMLRWNMPFNYIPEVGEQLTHTGVSRLIDFRMDTVYPAMINNGNTYDEYNVFLAMIKTSLFGESNFGQISRYISVFAVVMFVMAVILIVLQLIAFVSVMVNKESSLDMGQKLLFGVSAISLLGGYMFFALSYNNFSAQDFRYSALLISIMAVILGVWDDRLAIEASTRSGAANKKQIILRMVIMGSVILFALASAAVYLLAGLL